MKEKQTPEKTPVPMREGKNGGKLKSGGNPTGAGGRPPDEFRRRMRELATRQETEAYTEKCLKGEFGPKFHLAALNYVTDRGYGKAAQPITGEDGKPFEAVITRRVIKADAG